MTWLICKNILAGLLKVLNDQTKITISLATQSQLIFSFNTFCGECNAIRFFFFHCSFCMS